MTWRRHDERGQSAVEMVAYLPIILLVFLMALEAFAVFQTLEQVTSAARAGARIAGQYGDDAGRAAASRALSHGVREGATIVVHTEGRASTATVRAEVPVLFHAHLGWHVSKTATMPVG